MPAHAGLVGHGADGGRTEWGVELGGEGEEGGVEEASVVEE